MRSQEIYVSLDIGTTSIKVVVAEEINDHINILGVGNEKSQGLSRGVIVDIDETVASIQRAVAKAEQKSGVIINDVIVGVPSNHLAVEECHGMIAVANENREITSKDVDNVISAAKARSVPPEREIISLIPLEFIVDGFNGIRAPRGMIGVRLELYAYLLTGPKTIIHNIKRCVQRAGLNITEIVLQPQALASVALSHDEREFGTVIIDMGGGQTSASIIYDNQLKYSFVDLEGGDFVTKDISIILNTSLDNAERVKREYGYAIADQTSDEEYFPVETVGKKEPVRVDERYLAEIIEARMSQIFETIYEDLRDVDALDLPGGFVLTGGASSLPGVLDLAKKYFGNQVRLYIPNQMGMRNPIYATSVGLIEYVASLDDIHRIAQGTYFGGQQPVKDNPGYSSAGPVGRSRYDNEEDNYLTEASNSQFDRPGPEAGSGDYYEDNYDEYEEDIYYEEYPDQDYNYQDDYDDQGFTGKIKSFFDSLFD